MASAGGPVVGAHKLLIATALVCALVFVGWEAAEYARTGDVSLAVGGAVALVAAMGLAAYLRSLRALGTRLTPSRDAPRDRQQRA
jgi:hypothetical protein